MSPHGVIPLILLVFAVSFLVGCWVGFSIDSVTWRKEQQRATTYKVLAERNADGWREERRRVKFLEGQIQIATGVLRKELPKVKEEH